MSTLDRPMSGDVLTFDLASEVDDASGAEHDSRTLAKQGPLRITVVSLGPGEGTKMHQAPGPVTLHGLQGRVTVHARGEEIELGTGRLVSLGPGVEHRVAAEDEGGVFLLTLVHPE